MFLPAKWSDPSAPTEETNTLDPNMTLAHITHNTSMILLHQRIGYPKPELKSLKLPNFYSAETCLSAAVETSTITREYLASAPRGMPISPHFSFCAFVSARVLLGMSPSCKHRIKSTDNFQPVHWRYYGVDLDPQFSVLVESMEEISRRWGSPAKYGPEIPSPLSGQLATRLRDLYHRCENESSFQMDVLGSTEDTPPVPVNGKQHVAHVYQTDYATRRGHPLSAPRAPTAPTIDMDQPGTIVRPPASVLNKGLMTVTPDVGTARGYQPQSSGHGIPSWTSPSSQSGTPLSATNNGNGGDRLSSILQSLGEDWFTEMDRVISFSDIDVTTLPVGVVSPKESR